MTWEERVGWLMVSVFVAFAVLAFADIEVGQLTCLPTLRGGNCE